MSSLNQMRNWGSGHPIRFDLFLDRSFPYRFSPFQKYDLLIEKNKASRVDVTIHDFKRDRSAFIERVTDVFVVAKNKIISSGDRKNPFVILDINPIQLKRSCPDCYELIVELFKIFRELTIAMCKDTLRTALEESKYSPSLNDLSKQLRITKENLQIIAPDICDDIVIKYRRSQKARKLESDQRNIAEVIECIKQMVDRGMSVNGSSLRRQLKRPGVFRNPVIRATVCDYLTGLGIPTQKI